MKLTIHVTASGAKRLLIVGSVLIVLGTAAVSLAVPVTFVSGHKLNAADLNQDFAATEAITVNTKSYSRAAVFVKATTTKYYGSMHTSTSSTGPTGYAGAKAICATLVAPSAHMCTAEELVRSAQLGINIPDGWYASGVQDAQNVAHDCKGWTSNDSNSQGEHGATWYQGYPGATVCSTQQSVLCCN